MDYRERIAVKVGILFESADQYLSDQITMEEAKERIRIEMASIRPAQFEAVMRELEKRLNHAGEGITSQKLFRLFCNYLTPPYSKLPEGHPLRNYAEEIAYARSVLLQIDEREEAETAEAEWQRLYGLLLGFTHHLARQEKNFFPLLISKGMGPQAERASALGRQASKALAENLERLENGALIDFLYYQRNLSKTFSKYLDLSERVLYVRALHLLSGDEFVMLRKKDDEEGYAYMRSPAEFIPETISWNGAGMPGDAGMSGACDCESDDVAGANNCASADLTEIPSHVKNMLLQGDGQPLYYDIQEGGRTFRITYSLLEVPDIASDFRQVGKDQNIAELFRLYPRFQEDFFGLEEELVSLKGSFGMELLNDSTVEMVAKSLRIDSNNLLDRINQLLERY
ncbi:MAG: hypothetical protein K0R19_2324 [Bacillota bacterium]|jgi:hypothetical protein|nr:hypothetical protein [Bacillota bacterium]